MTYVEGSGTLTIRKPMVLSPSAAFLFNRENADDMGFGLSVLFQAAPRVTRIDPLAPVPEVHSHRLPVMSKAP